MNIRWAFVLLGLCACASAPRPVVIPEPGRVLWEQCHRETQTFCNRRHRGANPASAACEQDRANEYAGLVDDPGRRQYLGSLGCRI